MRYSLQEIENQLVKRLQFPYQWQQVQNNTFDTHTNFIYKTFEFEALLLEIDNQFKKSDLYSQYKNYALNRWYNFWSAYAIENIFCALPNVKPNANTKHKTIDFTIFNTPFDHKTSIFPKGFGQNLEYAQQNPNELAYWLFKNQSTQQRFHLKNRLFVILYNTQNQQHWQLKAHVFWLKQIIENYMQNFDFQKLITINLNNHNTLTDIIWAVK